MQAYNSLANKRWWYFQYFWCRLKSIVNINKLF
jgi:hypothetical protein